jgi:glycosyltransferase involved in cell wall biosynthesis
MNLLYTLTTYPPSTGGAQIHQHQLARHLNGRHHVQVISHWDNNRTDWLFGTTIKAPSEENDYTIDDIRVHQMGMRLCEKVMMAPFALSYYPLMLMGMPPVSPIAHFIEKHLLFSAENADLIHNVRIGREGLSLASFNAARRYDIPFVLTPVHHPRWVGRRYKAYNKLYSQADALLALTEKEKEVLIQLGVDGDRVHVIGHGPVLEEEAFADSFLKVHQIEGPMILFLGQHYAYKGYKQVLEAAHIVWQREADAQFVFIGPEVEDSETVFAAYPDKRVHRLGKVSLQSKTDALAACSLLCVPSSQESFGGVYAEAWCFEKPVIGCNIPAVSEVISHGQDGFLVEQEPKEIADRILFLLQNPQEAHKMGQAGKAKVTEKYTWNRIAERVERVYNTLLKPTGK